MAHPLSPQPLIIETKTPFPGGFQMADIPIRRVSKPLAVEEGRSTRKQCLSADPLQTTPVIDALLDRHSNVYQLATFIFTRYAVCKYDNPLAYQ